MDPGCAEHVDLGFWWWTFTYPTRSRPKVEERLENVRGSKTIYRLTSDRAVEKFLADLRSKVSI
jgi:hypothetical protein